MGQGMETKAQLREQVAALKLRVAELEGVEREHRRARAELARAAYYDPVTGLPNRSLFFRHLTQALAQAKRHHLKIAVMFFSLDRFKLINDTLGHEAGDLLLREVALRLESALRRNDILARPGRDEFMILLQNLEAVEDVRLVAKRIITAIHAPVVLDRHELLVNGSIGISVYPDQGATAELLIQHAYSAMKLAKRQEAERFRVYAPRDTLEAFDTLLLENSLRMALRREEFYLHYQPQVNLADGRIVGLEALLRWNHPDFGPVSPATFVPVAERIGLMQPLSEWVVRTACAQNRALQDEGFLPMRMAVNFSPRQLHQKKLLQSIGNVLEETGLEPGYLELEITEGALVSNIPSTAATLAALADMGTHIAIDDFGTGYSSLSYLSHFRLDKLKIDKTFVDALTTDAGNASISRAIIALAHSLGLKVVAEGVETVEQLAHLRMLGCDQVQGYLFSRPLSSADLHHFLKQRGHADAMPDTGREGCFWGNWDEDLRSIITLAPAAAALL